MGIISRMFKPKAISTEMERMVRTIFGGGTTSSGVSISNDSAMRQATVYSCVNILSRTIGMLPCHVMERSGKNKEIAESFYLYRILHDMPNEWMTSQEFWSMAINHLTLRGNFYALKIRKRGLRTNSEITELIPFAPDTVQRVEQLKDRSLKYTCQMPDGTMIDILGSDIMHLKGLTINGYMGVNPIQYIRESIGLAMATEEFGARYFGNGTHPGMIIEHPGTLSAQAQANLKTSMAETYSGLGKSHRLMLLEEGMKAHAITINPEDSQFLETRRYQKDEIVDIFFGLPLTVMNSGNNTPTFASAEQFSIGFIMYALMPWIVNIEKAIYRDLLTPKEREKYYAKFNVGGLQRGAFKEQIEAMQTAINCEIINPNTARSWLDLNPYEGGDEYRSRTSTVKNTETTTDKTSTKEPVTPAGGNK